jgi:hypothetical protein
MVSYFDAANDPVIDFVVGNEEDANGKTLGLIVHRLETSNDNTRTDYGTNIVESKYVVSPLNVTENIIVRYPEYNPTNAAPLDEPHYVIIGGEYTKNSIQEVYFAKFSIDYWLTEWFDSNEEYSAKSDTLVGLVLDEPKEWFYALLQVQVN